MENNSTTTKRPLLKPCLGYGGVLASILIIFSILAYFINFQNQTILGLLNYVIIALGMFYFAKKYRDEISYGSITYGRALGVSVLTILFASVIVAIYTVIFMKFIAPEVTAKALIEAEEKMLEQNPNMSEEQIEMALNMAKMFMSPIMLFIISIIGTTFMGTLFGLITSIFVKKEASPFEFNTNEN